MDRKALSLPILFSLVIGNMIGTGIFILPASLAHYGPYSLLAWLFTSVGAILFALTITSLNRRYMQTGGLYVFCREAFGRMTGFIVGYLYLLANLISIAGLAVASVSYLGYLTPLLNADTPNYQPYFALIIELIFVWLFTIINLMSVHTAGVMQLFLTLIKIVPLLLIAFLGLRYVQLDNVFSVPLNTHPDFSSIGSAAALTFWAFIGVECATIPAESTKGPDDIYKATLYGTCITSFIYLLSAFVLMGMIPAEQLQSSPSPFSTAANIIFGTHSAIFIALCALIAGLGALNVTILIQGQIIIAAARDQLFPIRFSKISKHDVPVAGQILSSVLVSLILIGTLKPTLMQQFSTIALMAALFAILAYLVTSLSEIKFLLRDYGFNTKLLSEKYTYISLATVLYFLWMISNFEGWYLLTTGIVVIALIGIYLSLRDKNRPSSSVS